MNNGKNKMVPKHCGGDYEIGHFIEGEPTGTGDAPRAAILLLRQLEGAHGRDLPLHWSGRKWLKNGGCAYIDCQHLELPMPEVGSAMDHCAGMRAMFALTSTAKDAVNAQLPPGERLHVLLSNTDAQGHSFGTHLNFLTSGEALANITGRSQRHLLFLASYQAVTVPLFGQGKVGADEGAPAVDYQLSQRADFCRYKLLCENTMHPHRPLVNTRDESHCGHPDFRRLHVIAYDNSLAQVTCVLKVGLMQIALAMIEAGEMPDHLVLANPLEALVLLSHDPTLQVKAPRVTGGPVTAPEWFDLFVAAAHRFAADGKLEGIVPDWTLILRLAAETAGHLLKRHFPELARRLDSFLKLAVLQEAMKLHGLDWQSPAIRMLDQLYASLGDDGLFWQYEKAGLVETLVPEENIARFQHSAPADTRASIRAKLLELIPPAHLVAVDWGRVVFDMTDKDQKSRRVSISLTSPAEFLQPGSALARATSFDELTAISTSQSSHPIHEAPREEAAENSPALPS